MTPIFFIDSEGKVLTKSSLIDITKEVANQTNNESMSYYCGPTINDAHQLYGMLSTLDDYEIVFIYGLNPSGLLISDEVKKRFKTTLAEECEQVGVDVKSSCILLAELLADIGLISYPY